MIRNIIYTFSSRLAGAFLSFLVVWLTARYLGAEIRGEISLFLLNVTVITLVNNIFGGPALVFLVPRYNVSRLFFTGYIWIIFSSALMSAIVYSFNQVTTDLLPSLFILSIISSWLSFNLNLILGLEKIKLNNLVYLFQLLFLLIPLILYIFVFQEIKFTVFINSLYISYGLGLVMSFTGIWKNLFPFQIYDLKTVIRKTFKHGFLIQIASILQLLNYRFSYYIIESFRGITMLGIYSVAITIAEAVWLLSKSIAMVQYSRISNTKDIDKAKEITVSMVKLSFTGSFIIILFLLVLPSDVYSFIFGDEFNTVKEIIIFLAPGIIALAVSTIFTHYFSGLGKNHLNTIASGLGLIFTVIFCYILIPAFGLTGAAISTSISYIASLLFLGYKFVNQDNVAMTAFLPSANDLRVLRKIYQNNVKN